jgi:hypothetical protein
MILPALERGGYRYRRAAHVGNRFGGGRHIVDVVAHTPDGTGILISLKWQQVSGTTEQKIPFELICLAETVLAHDNDFEKAYLVLGGSGWKLRDFYVSGGLARHLVHSELVKIETLESFVAKANKGAL